MEDTKLYKFKDDGEIPNNPKLPLVLYQKVLSFKEGNPAAVQQMFRRNRWNGSWVNGIYSYHHYHSTAHEVLAVTRGWALVRFGGKKGKSIRMEASDLVVIPAGVGHCLIESSPDFQVVGAYPEGQEWDLRYAAASERKEALENIRLVSLPAKDPLTGEREPLLVHWKRDNFKF